MHVYSELNRPVRITTPLGPELLLVNGISGREAISEPFEFHLDLVARNERPVESGKILGQPVTVELALPGQPAVRHFHGIVRRFIERNGDATFTHFEAVVVPKLWLATQKLQSRVFQRKTVPEILAEVLQGIDVRQDLLAGYAARDCCVQYRESDFAFASRLMEEEGIFYYFVHSAGRHEMVLSDNVADLAPVTGDSTIRFEQDADAPRRAMQVTAWKKIEDVCPVTNAMATAQPDAASSLRIEGQSGCAGLSIGAKFTLVRHPNADGDYYLTRIDHKVRCHPSCGSAADAPTVEYENGFHCLPATTVYRPARSTPKPTILGPQTATVVGSGAGQPPVDESGRIRVQFHWDRQAASDARHFCWVRVGQVWTDPRGGACSWPQVGHEVIVAFEDGDPDQPIVTGSVYGSKSMPPVESPRQAAARGAKSRSRGGEPVMRPVEAGRAFPAAAILPGLEPMVLSTADSGAGGGMLEWFTGIGGLAGSDAAETVNEFLPGSQTYTMGTSLSTVMIGDSVSEVLAGAAIQFVVDVESVLEEIPVIGTLFKTLGWLLSGCGGVNYATLGPQNTLVYSGANMNITRGEEINYHTDDFWTDWKPVGIAVKVLFLLVTAAAVAGNVLAMLNAETKTSEDGEEETEYPEWAKLISTAVASRLLALLNFLEKSNALACEAEEKVTAAAKELADAGVLAAKFTAIKDWATPLITDAAKKGTDAAKVAADAVLAAAGAQTTADEGARHSRVMDGDFSITANNITVASRPPLAAPGGTKLTLSSVGVAELCNGNVDINGTGYVMVRAGGNVGVGIVQSTPATGEVSVSNSLLGKVTLQQGPGVLPGPTTAGIVLSSLAGPVMNLTAGVPEINSSIELSMTGISLQFGPTTSLTIDATGITAMVGTNKIVIGVAGITIEATPASSLQLQPTQMSLTTPQMTLSPTTAYTLTTVDITESASGTVARTGSMQQYM